MKYPPLVELHGGGFFGGGDVRATASEALDEYRGWAYACVRSISENVGEIELAFEERKGDKYEVTNDDPVLDFMADMNPYFTSSDIIGATQAFLELTGEAFWWVGRVGGDTGAPTSVWVLRPDLITVVPDAEDFIKEYAYKVGGKTFHISPDNIIQFKEFNPKNPFRGYGTALAASSSINADQGARAWQAAFFKNGARIDGVITKDGDMTDEEYKTINNRWNDRYRGAEKSHKTAVLSNGLHYQAIGVTATDMDFVNLRNMSRDEILAMFRVPKTILGVTDGTQTRATAETSEYVYMKQTIKPKMKKFVRTLNEYLLPMFGIEPRAKRFTFKDPVPGNRELDLKTYESGISNGYMSVNEVRGREGLPPVEGGDDVRAPFGTEVVGTVKEQPKSVNEKPRSKGKKNAVDTIAGELASFIAPAFKEAAEKEDFETRGLVAHKGQTKRGDAYIKKMEGIMDDYFDESLQRVLDSYDEAFKKNAKMSKAAGDDLVDEDAEAKEIANATTKFFNVLVQAEGDAAMALVGLDSAFDARDERVQKALKKAIEKFAASVSAETAVKIKEALDAGFTGGESVTQIRKRIEQSTAFDSARSTTIARTEVVRTQNFASIEAWRDSGLVEKKVWYTAEDERVEPECAALHGKEFELDATIADDDYGDIDAPPLHPNCRCTLLPVTSSKAITASATKGFDPMTDLDELQKIEKELEAETL